MQTYDLSDPALLEMMRHGRVGVAGVAVNERQALRNSTFFRAMNLIAGAAAALQFPLPHCARATPTTPNAEGAMIGAYPPEGPPRRFPRRRIPQ